MRKRIAIFLDGGNFYRRLIENNLKQLLHFDYREFSNFLCRTHALVSSKYYIGVVREENEKPKTKILMANQQKLFHHLKQCGWHLGKGHMLKIWNAYHEKGVDVYMAVDLVSGAYEDAYDRACVVSSDTDLLPAIEKVQQLGKEVEYIGFAHKPSFAIMQHTKSVRLLTKEDLEQFLPPQS